jgi:ATP-dependent exoDNAse (exonuclease V) beta subunit
MFVGAIDQFEENRHQTAAEESRLLYVAMTRATLSLGLSAQRQTPLVEHVRAQLRQLEGEWAEMG